MKEVIEKFLPLVAKFIHQAVNDGAIDPALTDEIVKAIVDHETGEDWYELQSRQVNNHFNAMEKAQSNAPVNPVSPVTLPNGMIIYDGKRYENQWHFEQETGMTGQQ